MEEDKEEEEADAEEGVIVSHGDVTKSLIQRSLLRQETSRPEIPCNWITAPGVWVMEEKETRILGCSCDILMAYCTYICDALAISR